MIRSKHLALSLIALPIVIFLYWINVNWGNSVWRSFQLSFWSFWLIFLLFAFYWEIRDFWQNRWVQADRTNISSLPLSIPVEHGEKIIAAEYLHNNLTTNLSTVELSKTKPLIIFSHGFSDDRIKSSFITIPLVLMNHDLVIYDARGAGKSRKVGNKNQFEKIITDLGEIIQYVHNQPQFSSRPIYLVGFSLGAMGSLIQGIQLPYVQKIIVIAGISDFRENFAFSPMPFKASWWIWARYQFFGVQVNPSPKLNAELSPILHLQDKRDSFNNQTDWIHFTNRTIYLIHSKNDSIIKIQNFNENLKICELSNKNWFLTEHGGHMFRKSELALLGAIEYGIMQPP
jgi:pimeloyl-ACP methyl ester carboxylesterase